MHLRSALLALVGCLVSNVCADTTIVSVGGTPIFNGLSAEIFDWPYTASWTQTQSYSDVTISTVLQPTGLIDSFLTTSIGPGTDVTSQVASSYGVAGPPTGSSYPILTGLTLPAGTYYLTLWCPRTELPSALWALLPSDSASIVTDTGVTVNPSMGAPSVDYPAYPPSGSFHTLNYDLLFSVTGTPVPEPMITGLFLTLFLLRRRKRRVV
jgi:hypothetical protein